MDIMGVSRRMSKWLLVTSLLIISSLSVSAMYGDYCYQETATTSVNCGNGIITPRNGSYASTTGWSVGNPATNTYDGNWATFGAQNGTIGVIARVYSNYSMFPGVDARNSKIMTKYANGNVTNITTTEGGDDYNCFMNNNGNLSFTTSIIGYSATNFTDMVSCKAVNWIQYNFNDATTNRIYETGVYWALHYGLTNASTPSGAYFGEKINLTLIVSHDGNLTDANAVVNIDGITYTPTKTVTGSNITFSTQTVNLTSFTNILYNWTYNVTFSNGASNGTNVLAYNSSTAKANINLSFVGVTTGNHYNVTCTEGSGASLTTLSREGFYYFSNGSHSLSCAAAAFYPAFTLNFSASTTNTNITANISEYNLNLTFRDDETGTLINTTTVEYELISTLDSRSGTTTNGTARITALGNYDYVIRYGALGYSTRFYTFNPSALESALNLTLLSTNTTTDVTITVKDEIGYAIEGATIKVLKYDVATNSYLINQILASNFEGQAQANLILENEYYKFIIEINGEEVYATEPTYVFSTTITFYVVTGGDGFEQHFLVQGIYGNITFNSANNISTFTYDDTSNTATQGCLYIYEQSAMTLINSTCSAGVAGSIQLPIYDTEGDTYLYKGYVTIGTENYLVATNIVSFSTPAEIGSSGLFYLLIFELIMVGIGIYSLPIAIFLAGLGPFLFGITKIATISPTVTVPLAIVGLIVAIMVEVTSK